MKIKLKFVIKPLRRVAFVGCIIKYTKPYLYVHSKKNKEMEVPVSLTLSICEISKTCSWLFLVQLEAGMVFTYRIDETKLVCAISRNLVFG